MERQKEGKRREKRESDQTIKRKREEKKKDRGMSEVKEKMERRTEEERYRMK